MLCLSDRSTTNFEQSLKRDGLHQDYTRDKSVKRAYLGNIMTRAQPYDRDTALDAALMLFWTKGYHATSLKDLEAALHMKPGSIYAAFKNKETLYLTALERYFERSRAGLLAEIDRAATPLQGLSNHLRKLGNGKPGDPRNRACMILRTLLDTSATDARIADTAQDYLDRMLTEFATVFERSKQLGELAKDADTTRLARRYQASINALRIEHHRGADQAARADLAEDLATDLERLGLKPDHVTQH